MHGAERIDDDTLFQNMDSWKLYIFLVLQLFATVMLLVHMLKLNGGNSLVENIFNFRGTQLGYKSAEEVDTALPVYVRLPRRVSVASGYIWVYLLAHSFVYKNKRNRKLIVFNLLLSMITDLLLGGRQGAITIILAGVVDYYMIYGYKTGWNSKIRLKSVFYILLIGIAMLSVFQASAVMLGRQSVSRQSFADYLSIYLAAPLKNLDIYISLDRMGERGGNYLSLPGLTRTLSVLLNDPNLNSTEGYPYNYLNGYAIGNAYTIFYAFVHDHGYWGVIVYTSVMAALSQIFCQRSRVNAGSGLSVDTVIYSFMLFGVIFGFFGNFFYITVVKKQFIWNLLVWFTMRWFLLKKIRLFKKNIRFKKRTVRFRLGNRRFGGE